MKKYIGLVNLSINAMAGSLEEIRAKFSDDKAYIEKWFDLYPNAKKILLDNTQQLNNFFIGLQDSRPVTEEEIKEAERVYKDFKESFKNEESPKKTKKRKDEEEKVWSEYLRWLKWSKHLEH